MESRTVIEPEKLAYARAQMGARSLFGLDGQKVVLGGIIVALTAGIWFVGGLIAPIIASIVIAYILDGITLDLRRKGLPPTLIATILTVGFVAAVGASLFMAGPLLVSQTIAFAQSLPGLAGEFQTAAINMAAQYDGFISEDDVRTLTRDMNQRVVALGQTMVVSSLSLLPTLASVSMYLLIVPLMLFFFIKDRDQILEWSVGFLPDDRRLAEEVWQALSLRFGGYLRGKAYEIIIVGGVCYVSFLFLELEFPVMLASIAGLSVLIPYFGAPLAGVPVMLVAYSQWGMGDEFFWVLAAYTIIQILDGAVLATVLLASTVRLHPVAVMVAVLLAGQLLGFWGLLFAIPLASAVEVIMDVWRARREEKRRSDPTIEIIDRCPNAGKDQNVAA